MSDSNREFAALLAQMERRLQALETAPRANNTSVRDGYTRWLPVEDNGSHMRIGALTGGENLALVAEDSAGRWTFVGVIGTGDLATIGASNPDGILSGIETFRIFGGVMHAPLFASTWQRDGYHAGDANGNPLISAGAYETAFRTLIPCTSGRVFLRYDILLGGGVTSCATRVTAKELGSAVAAQTIHEVTGIVAPANVDTTVAIPTSIASPAASPIGRVVQLEIQSRVTGGAGNVTTVAVLPALNKVS